MKGSGEDNQEEAGYAACFLVFFFSLHHMAYRILVLQPGIEPVPSAVEARMLNHWTSRGSPCSLLLIRIVWVVGGPKGERCQSNKRVWVGERCGRGSEPMRTTSILGPRRFTWSAPRLLEAYWETDNCDKARGFLWTSLPFPLLAAFHKSKAASWRGSRECWPHEAPGCVRGCLVNTGGPRKKCTFLNPSAAIFFKYVLYSLYFIMGRLLFHNHWHTIQNVMEPGLCASACWSALSYMPLVCMYLIRVLLVLLLWL